MVIDLRKQNRKITIDFEQTGYFGSLDNLVDKAIKDIKESLKSEERDGKYDTKITITIE